MKRFVVQVQEDKETGECYIEFPDEVITESGWQEGDVLQWIDNGDGSFSLKKKE
jgi:hypothetical protein